MITIGEIILSDRTGNSVLLECKTEAEMLVSIIVMDRLGRSMLEYKSTLSPSDSSIALPVSKLDPGTYHAWIDAGGQTFIRNIVVEGKAEGAGFLRQFTRFFS